MLSRARRAGVSKTQIKNRLTYAEVGNFLGVHPLHVRRIVKRYPKLIQPIVEGYNRITFDLKQVERVKVERARDGVKALKHMAGLRKAVAK